MPPTSSSFSHSVNFSHIKSNEHYPPFRGSPQLRGEPHGSIWRGLTEQTGEQGHENKTDERDTAAGHELLHTLGLY